MHKNEIKINDLHEFINNKSDRNDVEIIYIFFLDTIVNILTRLLSYYFLEKRFPPPFELRNIITSGSLYQPIKKTIH